MRALWNRRTLDFCLKNEAEEGLSIIQRGKSQNDQICVIGVIILL